VADTREDSCRSKNISGSALGLHDPDVQG